MFHRWLQNSRFCHRSPARAQERWRTTCAVRSPHRRVSRGRRARGVARTADNSRSRRRGRRRALPRWCRARLKHGRALKRRRRLCAQQRTRPAERPSNPGALSRRALSIHLTPPQEFLNLRERRRRITSVRLRLAREPRRRDRPVPSLRLAREPRASHRLTFHPHLSHDHIFSSPLVPSALINHPFFAPSRRSALALVSPEESPHELTRDARRAPHRRGHATKQLRHHARRRGRHVRSSRRVIVAHLSR